MLDVGKILGGAERPTSNIQYPPSGFGFNATHYLFCMLQAAPITLTTRTSGSILN
jgi:hypothetical protein